MHDETFPAGGKRGLQSVVSRLDLSTLLTTMDYCPVVPAAHIEATFHKKIRGQIWKVNSLLLIEAVLAGVMVGIGAFGQRYRRHPFTRLIFLGATTLFLPIISSVVSTIGSEPNFVINFSPEFPYHLSALVATCDASNHSFVLVMWAFLVQIVMINTSVIVSVDEREGQSTSPPLELLVKGGWTLYLGVTANKGSPWISIYLGSVTPFALLGTKIVVQWYASRTARRSFSLGRNPGLVFVYMQQLQAGEASQDAAEPPVSVDVPPLLVMREDEKKVEVQPGGYAFKDDYSGTTLISNIDPVTLDRIWQLDSALPISTPPLKHLCLSLALFKLLRCRFARYHLTNAGSMGTLNFFRSLVLKADDHDTVFGAIADELSFVHDYYYSSLPNSYSKPWLPILFILLSLLDIGMCILFLVVTTNNLIFSSKDPQITCFIWCTAEGQMVGPPMATFIGMFYFDLVPLLSLLVLAVVAEVRDMSSYICSNWTKVSLICRYVNRASLQHSICMQRWVSLLLRCRCKLMKHWDEKMSQCSVLVLPPRTNQLLVRRLFRLPDRGRNVKMPAAVKVCIFNALTSVINGSCLLSNGVESLHRSQVGDNFIWACHGKGASDIILVWHIATCILEVKQYDQDSNSDHKIAATHLSRYCAYLVNWCPELLPDNKAWSKSLYEAVKKDVKCALAEHPASGSSTPEDEHRKLVELLQANSKHELLKNGVKLGMLLVDTFNDEEAMWKLLADFWSELILYVAPSDNLEGHKEAIARGGELITLLWAMLFHAGIASRTGEHDGATATSGSAV
uniref:DUF4220 domain-containing protein n=1 Tax=Setaria viridis TaxID=4556 RepID=A0A4U6UVV9_SETVI|nr:uncharacterized protein LOC117851864 [Setaria viridis]TKW19394.1 hypothetical protein SEVIR_4G017200v2 [Setaria viridis]